MHKKEKFTLKKKRNVRVMEQGRRIGIKVRNKSAKNDAFVSLVKALNRRGGKF